MVNKALRAVLDELFPTRCALCELYCPPPLPLCHWCRASLPLNHRCCRRCALPLATAAPLCGPCLQQPPVFKRAYVPFVYDPHLRYLIGHWKYRRARWLTPLLAQLWLQALPLPPVDALVPVPLHWRRAWHRGFNQAELLARALASGSAGPAPAVWPQLVYRQHATAEQATLSARQRRQNLQQVFQPRRRLQHLLPVRRHPLLPSGPQPLLGKRLAIVDDVLTTGSTCNALATQLLALGAQQVVVCCLARTPLPGSAHV